MSLLDRARESIARLKVAESARTGVEEAQTLDALRRDLSDRATRIGDVAARAKVLRAEGVVLSKLPQIEKANLGIANVAARFREKPVSTTLKQGKRWKDLLESLDMTNKIAGDAQLEDWKTYYRTRLFAGLPPTQVKVTLALTPANIKALATYAELFNKFSAYKAVVPPTGEAIQEVKRCSKALEKIKFDQNVPDDVAKFFEATASSTGASLDLLTDTVLKWLRSNMLLGNYVARARLD